MKQHRESFLFQVPEKYFQRDSAHHYKSIEWQLELQEVQSTVSFFTIGGNNLCSVVVKVLSSA